MKKIFSRRIFSSLAAGLMSIVFFLGILCAQAEKPEEPVFMPAPDVPSLLPDSGKSEPLWADSGVAEPGPAGTKKESKEKKTDIKNNAGQTKAGKGSGSNKNAFQDGVPKKRLKPLRKQPAFENGGGAAQETPAPASNANDMQKLAEESYYRQAQAISNAVHGKNRSELICDKRAEKIAQLKNCPPVMDGVIITVTELPDGILIEGRGNNSISDISFWNMLDIYLPKHGTASQIKKMQFGKEITEAGLKCLGADIGDAYLKYTRGSATRILLSAMTKEALKEIRKAEDGWRKLQEKRTAAKKTQQRNR